ncbi:hypothetical protein E7T06_08330 [Deinococcus sp. Arct2-2]|uniref:hypothetical protein n=1 Tax=Deinococcus sp. Arct2-2 TaxID=2568653 RepID=UPI0010A30DFD|nr:hypothetical protein [Deinococcus sp. Arct2-2]THF70183.1 hypothetical protein E7T06_08330 [Deinococcus sp. Arct2-2]
MLTYGWPGLFVKLERLVRLLAYPDAHGADSADAFHVAVQSLPGFGFSNPSEVPSTHSRQIAGRWAQLMTRLG